MKLRIKGNSLRFRLSVTEVDALSAGQTLTEHTRFVNNDFIYEIKPSDAATMNAVFTNNTITLSVPKQHLHGWPTNNKVGFEGTVDVGDGESLKLLLEKDFKCIDNTDEDQSEFFENPAKQC